MRNLTLLIKPAAGLCNMRCRYCFYQAASAERENRIMTRQTADELIRKIKAYRPSRVSVLFQGGEPTLAGTDFYRYFTRRMKESVPAPVTYGLQTNGLLIDDAFAELFREQGFLVGLSLDGAKRTNDRYRRDGGGEGVLPRVLEAAALLRGHGVDFNILSVVDDENAREIEATWRWFKKHGFRFLQFIPCLDEGSGISLSPEGYERFLKQSFDLWYGDFLRGDYISVRHIDNYIGVLMGRPPENCAMGGVCGGYFVVEANGDLYPCDFYCRDDYRIGAVADAEPFAINNKHRAFIDQSRLIHDRCRGCRYYPLCRGGCRRDRINGLTENRYCGAYTRFFDYAIGRMERIAGFLGGTDPFAG